jgi:hypothetical protein
VTLPAVSRPLEADASTQRDTPLPSLLTLLYRYRNTEAVREHLPALHPLAWAVFARIVSYMWGRASANPSQVRLAREIGWSERAIRKHSRELFEKGVLVATKVVRAHVGGFRYVYEPGPAFIAALEARWRADMGRRRAKTVGGPRPERAKGADTRAPDVDPIPEIPLLDEVDEAPEPAPPCASAPAAPPSLTDEPAPVAEPTAPPDEPEETRVARAALSYVSEKKHGCIRPGVLPVADAEKLALVASRVGMLAAEGEAARLELVRAAIDAAFARSKHGSPSLRYIFGEPEHFAEHARKGAEALEAARREEAERAAREARKAAKAQARATSPDRAPKAPETADRAAPTDDAKTFAELALASLGELSAGPSAPRPVVVKVRRIE